MDGGGDGRKHAGVPNGPNRAILTARQLWLLVAWTAAVGLVILTLFLITRIDWIGQLAAAVAGLAAGLAALGLVRAAEILWLRRRRR